MGIIGAVLGVLVGVLGGIAGGYKLGELVRGNRRGYWALNGGALVLCMGLDFAGLATGRYWLAFAAVGLMGGLLTGLKYGYAESIGVWRFLDTWTGTDKELRPPKEPRR